MKTQDNPPNTNGHASIDPEKFRLLVEERAYFKAQRRGFSGGHELDDWLEAEQEIKNQYRYWLLDPN